MPESLVHASERNFLLHWNFEAGGPFWGPATIWCVNHRVNPAYGPYPLAELFWDEERQAGRTFWTGVRPEVPFQVPWENVGQFWHRVNLALCQVRRLQGDARFTPFAFAWQVEGTLTPEESDYLRAYNAEMVQTGSGHHIDLTHRHGVLSHHLIPFFVRLEDLYRPTRNPVAYPWANFPARYQELSGRQYDHPDYAPYPRVRIFQPGRSGGPISIVRSEALTDRVEISAHPAPGPPTKNRESPGENRLSMCSQETSPCPTASSPSVTSTAARRP